MNDCKIYSFDVFDTCITRTYFQPIDLFLDLALKVLSMEKGVFFDGDVRRLAQDRALAESKARDTSAREDVTLEDIYEELERIVSFDIDVIKMKKMEIDLELNSVKCNPRILKAYKKLKDSNQKVIFISDMYLPSPVIAQMLSNCGFSAVEQDVLVSGDVGLTKGTGNLFKYVLNKYNIPAKLLFHHGDNIRSDVDVARSLGVNASYIGHIHSNSRYEKGLVGLSSMAPRVMDYCQKKSKLLRKFYVNPLSARDLEKQVVMSRVSAISRLVRFDLECKSRSQGLNVISANLASPLLVSFVYWVLFKSRENGIKRLYFVARNGQIFYKIAVILLKNMSSDIECRYIYGSRSSWYFSGFSSVDDKFIEMLGVRYVGRSILDVFAILGISRSDLDLILNSEELSYFDVEKPCNKLDFFEYFLKLKNLDCCSVLNGKLIEYNECFYQYFESEKVFSEGEVGFVDVGWQLTAHNTLYSLLKERLPNGFTGFYFGVRKRHEAVNEKAPFYAYFSNEFDGELNWLFRLGAIMIIEDVFTAADHGTTKCYQNNAGQVSPVYHTRNPCFTEDVQLLQEGVLLFAKMVSEERLENSLSLIKYDLLRLFEQFYKYPEKEEVLALAHSKIYVVAGHVDKDERVLSEPISVKELARVLGNLLLKNRDFESRWVWFQGSMAISGVFVSGVGKVLSFLESYRARRLK